MTAPDGPSATAAEAVAVHMFAIACGAPLAVSRRWFRGEGIDKEDRDKFLSHARVALAEVADRPALRALVRAETIAEVLALLDDETEKAESAFGGRTPFSLALGTMAERVRAMLDPDPTPPEVAP